MDGLQNKVEALSDEFKKETQKIVMTEQSLLIVKKMQEEIEFLQKRMIDAYSLKELDQQMQERVSTLVDNNTKLGKIQRKQIKGIQDKVLQLESGYSLVTESQSTRLQAKIAEYMESGPVMEMIDSNVQDRLRKL